MFTIALVAESVMLFRNKCSLLGNVFFKLYTLVRVVCLAAGYLVQGTTQGSWGGCWQGNGNIRTWDAQ